jgi:hypothetical protein
MLPVVEESEVSFFHGFEVVAGSEKHMSISGDARFSRKSCTHRAP